jgi:hypothetical protein
MGNLSYKHVLLYIPGCTVATVKSLTRINDLPDDLADNCRDRKYLTEPCPPSTCESVYPAVAFITILSKTKLGRFQ